MAEGQRLSEEQVSAAIRRAAEIQHAAAGKPVESGITAEDLVRIGSELGVEEGALRQAIAEVTSRGFQSAGTQWKLGIPVRYDESAVLPVELTDDDWVALLEELRRQMGEPGQPTQLAGGHEWQATGSGLLPLMASFRPKDGTTQVRITGDLGQTGVLLGFCATMLTLGGMGISAADFGTASPSFFLATGVIASTAGVVWHGLMRRIGRRRHEAVRKVLEFAQKLAVDRKQQAVQPVAQESSQASTDRQAVEARLHH